MPGLPAASPACWIAQARELHWIPGVRHAVLLRGLQDEHLAAVVAGSPEECPGPAAHVQMPAT